MEFWVCPHCERGIYGSLEVVLVLGSAHQCRGLVRRTSDTTCLKCLLSPTGLCGYHTHLLVRQYHDDTLRIVRQ